MNHHPFIPGNLIRPNPDKPFANSSENSAWTPLAIVLHHQPPFIQNTSKLLFSSHVRYIDITGHVRFNKSMFPDDWEVVSSTQDF